jgi:hypothetical protein
MSKETTFWVNNWQRGSLLVAIYIYKGYWVIGLFSSVQQQSDPEGGLN